MSALNYPDLQEVKDLTDSIPDVEVIGKVASKELIESLIRVAYWRGVHHHKDDPEGTRKRLEQYINSL